MDTSKLKEIIDTPEGTYLEFKKSLTFTERVAKSICAFANTYGGYVIVGVEKEDGTRITGVQDKDSEFQKLAGITPRLHPKPYYDVEERELEGKTILVIHVNQLPTSELCFFKKTAYRRVGSINEELSGQNLVRFMQQRGVVSFEDNKSLAGLSDLERGKITNLLKNRGLKAEDHEPIHLQSLLSSLGVANQIGEFYLKNSAVLFFAKDVKRFFMNPEIRIVKYRGTVKALEALKDDVKLVDTLPELLEASFSKIKQEIRMLIMSGGGKRTESLMIPEEVIREALTNAVGHRDYFDPNGILVEIFEDRVEITNPGSLLPGQTLKNFSETRRHRNPTLYRLLNDSKWGEGLNLGVKAMYRIMRQNKLPDPQFEDLGGMFRVTLYTVLSRRRPKPYGEITERQQKAIAYLEIHKILTAPRFAKIAGISHPTAIRDLNDMVAQGVLRKTGSYRSSKYELEKQLNK